MYLHVYDGKMYVLCCLALWSIHTLSTSVINDTFVARPGPPPIVIVSAPLAAAAAAAWLSLIEVVPPVAVEMALAVAFSVLAFPTDPSWLELDGMSL